MSCAENARPVWTQPQSSSLRWSQFQKAQSLRGQPAPQTLAGRTGEGESRNRCDIYDNRKPTHNKGSPADRHISSKLGTVLVSSANLYNGGLRYDSSSRSARTGVHISSGAHPRPRRLREVIPPTQTQQQPPHPLQGSSGRQ